MMEPDPDQIRGDDGSGGGSSDSLLMVTWLLLWLLATAPDPLSSVQIREDPLVCQAGIPDMETASGLVEQKSRRLSALTATIGAEDILSQIRRAIHEAGRLSQDPDGGFPQFATVLLMN